MGAIKVPTNFNIELEFEIPEFYRRLVALLLDILIEFFYFRIIVEVLSAGKQKAFAQYDTGSRCNDYGGNFQCPVDKHH